MGADKSGECLYARGLQQCGKKSVFVLAVPILIRENLRGGMRHVPPGAERDADIAKLDGHVIIDGADLFEIRTLSTGQLFGLARMSGEICNCGFCKESYQRATSSQD